MAVRFPKPETRLAERTRRTREDKRAELAFLRAVWDRDEGRCRVCGCRCVRTLSLHPRRGDVHHLYGRTVRALRFDPRAAILVCAKDHEALTQHRLSMWGSQHFDGAGRVYLDGSGPLRFVERGA